MPTPSPGHQRPLTSSSHVAPTVAREIATCREAFPGTIRRIDRARILVLDARVKATLITTLIVLLGGTWQLSNLLRESVFTIPMSEPVKLAQIYYFANGYTQSQSAIVHAQSTADGIAIRSDLRFRAPERFRLDFIGDGTVRFSGKLIREQVGLFTKRVRTYALDISRLPVNGIGSTGERLRFVASADPYIDVNAATLPVLEDRSLRSWVVPAVIAVLLAIPIFVYRSYFVLRRNYLLLMATATLCCFLGIAGLTLPLHHGPDELLHVASGDWYSTHLLPPSMTDPHVPYDAFFGVNYIIGYADLTYLITFKTAALLGSVSSWALYERARIAQVMLFGLSVLFLLRFAGTRYALTLVLAVAIIPQVAYLMTYVNGDALSFCFGLVALSFVAGSEQPNRWILALSFFVLMNLKLPYLLLIPVACALLYRNSGLRYAPWASVGCLLGTYRYAYNLFDQAVSGRSFKANQILHAGPLIRPRLEHGFWDPSPLTDPDFYIVSLRSLYAGFGQMSFFFPPIVYVMGVILAAVLVWRNGWRVNLLLTGVFAITVAASLWFSCTYALQPQGRYLLPAVVVMMVFFAERPAFRLVMPFALVTLVCLMQFIVVSL